MGAEPHFGLRRQSEATKALFHSGVILLCIERQVIANAREAEQRKSGVALRFPPHFKNAAYWLWRPIVVFLVSPRPFITGTEYVIDGGTVPTA